MRMLSRPDRGVVSGSREMRKRVEWWSEAMRPAIWLWVIGTVVWPGASGMAEDFRIVTKVYAGAEEDHESAPVAETLTLFAGGVVYDFLRSGDREEMTVFDPQRRRFVLLDPKRHVQTTLHFDGVLSFTAQVKARLEETGRKEFAAPTFEVRDAKERGPMAFVLDNPAIRYTVVGERVPSPAASTQYQQFADWYARLNTMRPGNAPPFARLRLNSELATRQWIPREVIRVVRMKRGLRLREFTMRSRHQVTWLLSQSDRKRIERAGTAMASYRVVGFRQYLDIPQETAAR